MFTISPNSGTGMGFPNFKFVVVERSSNLARLFHAWTSPWWLLHFVSGLSHSQSHHKTFVKKWSNIYATLVNRVILPSSILVLISITAFIYLLRVIPATSIQKGLWIETERHCPNIFNENYPLHRRAFHSGGKLGTTLCVIFSIFDSVVQYGTSSRLFVINGLPYFGILTTFMLVESVRLNRPYPRACVVLLTSIAQLISGAATLPYFWILFLRNQYKHNVPARISASDANAAIMASLLGFFLPTILFLLYPTSIWLSTLWQVFPLVTLVSNKLAYFIFPERSTKQEISGDYIIKSFYLATFVLGAILHLGTRRSDFSSTFGDMIPKFVSLLDPNQGHTFEDASRLFLHWDAVFCFASALVADCWCGSSLAEGIKIFGWFALATPLVGATAASSGFYYWREQKIEQYRAAKVQ